MQAVSRVRKDKQVQHNASVYGCMPSLFNLVSRSGKTFIVKAAQNLHWHTWTNVYFPENSPSSARGLKDRAWEITLEEKKKTPRKTLIHEGWWCKSPFHLVGPFSYISCFGIWKSALANLYNSVVYVWLCMIMYFLLYTLVHKAKDFVFSDKVCSQLASIIKILLNKKIWNK